MQDHEGRVAIVTGGAQGIGFDADLVEQGEASRRTGREDEFGTA